MFAVPQMMTPQVAVTSTFLDQLQVTTRRRHSCRLRSPLEHLSLRCQLAPLCPVRRCLHLFRASLHHGQRVWVKRSTTYVLSPSRSLQRSPPTQRLQVPRLLRLRLQVPGRLQLHLLWLRVPPLRLGHFSATTTTTTPLASPFDLRGPSLPRRRILPLRLSLRLLFGACCQTGR
jgi:hypothetical protein